MLNQAVSGATEALAADEDDDGRPGLGSHPCTGLLAVRMHVSGEDGQVRQLLGLNRCYFSSLAQMPTS